MHSRIHPAMLVLLCLLCFPLPALSADSGIAAVLPAPSCANGWAMDGKVTLFDKDTLFDRINGESELYFPYGFEVLAYARYESKANPKFGIDMDVYKMGSLIDAFGMFANYRRKDDADLAIGAQGTISSSQVFFYQGRYFVRLQATGTSSISRDVFLGCATAVAKNLPESAARPSELEFFQLPEIVRKSEQYIAQSVLGYEFFRTGMVADALLRGQPVRIFLVIESSAEAARTAFERYRASVNVTDTAIQAKGSKARPSLSAVDPLYGTVYAEQAGRYVIGAVRITDPEAAQQFIGRMAANLP